MEKNSPLSAAAVRTLLILIVLGGIGCAGGDGERSADQEEATSLEYDSLLAAELGADEYGMRTYVMALLKAGPNRSQDSTEAAQLQQAHMENIQRLADEGHLILAGPFLDSGELRGIYVFDVETVEEARELTLTDPAVEAGRLDMELHPWYGSAALLELEDIQRRIVRTQP